MPEIENKITVEEAICELLYLHDVVIIPQLGGFEKAYKSTSFDYVQGKIAPPSSDITFNENLVVDDGLLIEHFKNQNSITLQEAKDQVNQFAQEAKLVLNNKEVVTFPKIGRLLKDYEKQTKFISENHNFNTETFGLSEVKYYPILRDLPKEHPPTPKKETVSQANPITSPKSKRQRKSISFAKIGIPIFIILVLLSAYWAYNWMSSKANVPTTENQDDKAVNVSPTDNGEEANDDVFADEASDDIDYSDGASVTDDGIEDENPDLVLDNSVNNDPDWRGDASETDAAESDSPSQNDDPIFDEVTTAPFKVIFVGLFSKQKGVDNYAFLIMENNWEPYTEATSGGSTRVGIRVPDDVSPQALLNQVRQIPEFSGAFIRTRGN